MTAPEGLHAPRAAAERDAAPAPRDVAPYAASRDVVAYAGPRAVTAYAAPRDVPDPRDSTSAESTPATLPRGISFEDLRLFRLIATGLPIEAVARRLDLSERTVRRRTRAACDRLGFGTAIEAIVWAAHRGLL